MISYVNSKIIQRIGKKKGNKTMLYKVKMKAKRNKSLVLYESLY